jgi:hypothetical protein
MTATDLPANIAYNNINNNFTVQDIATESAIVGTSPVFYLVDYGGPTGDKKWRIVSYQNSQTWRVEALTDLNAVQSTPLLLTRSGDIQTDGNIHEKSRVAPIGHWTDFTPVITCDVGTVTVNNIFNCSYILIGKTITLTVYFDITLSSTPSIILFPSPVGIVPNNYSINTVIDNHGDVSMIQTSPGDSVLKFYRTTSGGVSWATGQLIIGGTASFEFQ